MTLAILVFLGGALTIVSPCILPVLPFVFSRAEQPFLRGGLPLLAGMSLTFAGVATLAAVGGAWAVHINEYGRTAALVLLALFALTLLSRRLANWMARPFVAAGNRLTGDPAVTSPPSASRSLLIGIATGLLWAPCAGPILGLVLTGAAISGPNARTSLLLLAYAAGAATSLAIALLAGGRIFAALKRGLGAGEWIRRGLGVAVLAAVAVIGFGLDSGTLTRLSIASTDRLEHSLLDGLRGAAGISLNSRLRSTTESSPGSSASTVTRTSMQQAPGPAADLPVEGSLPPLQGATAWLNSPPLSDAGLRGKVVVIDFWTYSCINCLRALPYIKGWHQKYKDHGLVVIGVHAPEFAFERDPDNVGKAVRDLGVTYPVALDNNYSIWRAFNNQYWPAHYFIDARGRIRAHHFGEGNYAESEQIIRELLAEAGSSDLPAQGVATEQVNGVQLASDLQDMLSPETYVGYARSEHFSSPSGVVPDEPQDYTAPARLKLNDWALTGRWAINEENAVLHAPGGAVVFRFQARDLHLVLGPGPSGKPVRFRVRLDGADPGESHGTDTDARGNGVVREQRLYQLIRQPAVVQPRTFTIEFFDPGVQAYAFTFG